MQFRMLGPLTVENDRGPVALGGPKPRALLAALLVEAGRVVLRRPPGGRALGRVAAARRGVRVARLRVPAARRARRRRDRLRYQAPGYVLSARRRRRSTPPSSSSDLGAARARRRGRRPRGRAAAGSTPGWRLWRGDALAEFADLEFAAAEAGPAERAARWPPPRTASKPCCSWADPRRRCPTLEALARRHPTRERTTVVRSCARCTRSGRAGRRARGLPRAAPPARRRARRRCRPGRRRRRSTSRSWRTTRPSPAGAPGREPAARGHRLVGRDGSRRRRARRCADRAAGDPHRGRRGRQVPAGRGGRRAATATASPTARWLCELAPLARRRPGRATRVAAALQVQQRHGLTHRADRVIEYLRGRSLLLVLDNCEHVLDRGGPAGRPRSCGTARTWRCSPPAGSALGVDGRAAVAGAAAAGRGRRSRCSCCGPGGPAGLPASTAAPRRPSPTICAQLDGLPLGIELAAARMRAMSPAEVARRLDGRRLLGGGARPGRAATSSLAATIDWSYRLLPDAEQELFARLSVFAGGCDLRAAHRVCADPAPTEDDRRRPARPARRPVAWCVAQRAGHRTRYRVLETLRAYGRERLGGDRRRGGRVRRPARRLLRRARRAGRRRAAGPRRAGLGRARAARLRQPARRVRAGRRRPRRRPGAAAGRRRCPSWCTCASATSPCRLGRAGAGRSPDRSTRCSPPRSARRRAGRGTAASSPAPGQLAARAGGRVPLPGHRAHRLPGRRARRRGALRGRRRPGAGHYWRGGTGPRGRPTRSGWCGRSTTSRCATRCGASPAAGVAAARESLEVAEATANPTALSMARYALGLVLKKSEPDRGAGAVRRGGRAGRGRAQLLVARHRADGGGRHPRPCTATRRGRRARSSTCSTTGTGSATGPSSGSTCATSPGCCSPARRRRRRAPSLHALPPRGRETVPARRRRPPGSPGVRRPRCGRGRRRRARRAAPARVRADPRLQRSASDCNRLQRASPRRRALARTRPTRRTPP